MGTRGRGPGRSGTASALVTVVTTACVVLVLPACGADTERAGAAAASDSFAEVVDRDPGAACALLAPRTVEAVEQHGVPCEQALSEADLPTPGEHTAVTVAGHSAQVRYAEDTVFLALFDDGWRVTAAGCRRVSGDPAVPYECAVDGG